MKPIVFYHYPCLDGFTAAWAIWLKHPDWEFVPMKYGNPLPDATGRDVYFVDFTAKRAIMEEWMLRTSPNSITVLDHHKTAEADLNGFDGPTVSDPAEIVKRTVIFDMEKSGARLAWEYFHPDETVPALVKYVEDRDLWRFKYEDTKAVNAYMFSFDYDFKMWNRIRENLNFYTESVIEAGEAILRKQDKDIKELAPLAFRMTIQGYDVPVINVPYTYASDVCNLLAKGEPFAASYYFDGPRKKYIFSLRSDENGADVSEIAKKCGGGGHKHAAGFERQYFD